MPDKIKRTLYFFAATQAGDWWKVARGQIVTIKHEDWVVTGFSEARREVYISQDNSHRVITNISQLWADCSMQWLTPHAAGRNK